MDELKEMSTKCQGIITTSTEELQTAFRIDIRAAVAELKPLADKLQASQGEQAIETAKSFAAKSELYFTKHVTALHHKMRTLYLHHHGADFVIDQLPKLEGSLENASMGLSVIQRQWRQAIYPSLLEKVADASHSSVALQEKEKELKAATEKVQELEGLNKLMRSKVQQRDSELADLMLKNEELKKQLSQNGVVDNDPCDSCLADTYSYVTITPSIMAASTNTTDDVNTTIPDVVGDDAGLETTDTIVKKDVDLSSRSDTEDRPSGGFADSLDGLTSVVPNVVNSGRVEKESTVPVLLSNMKMACQCIKLSSDFYSCLAKLLRVGKPDKTCGSTTGKGDTIDASHKSDQIASSPDALSRTLWPQLDPCFSISDVLYSESIDLVAELKSLIDQFPPVDLKELHETVKAAGQKISVDSFGVDDLVVFWPTSDSTVYRALSFSSDKITFLSPKSALKMGTKDKGDIFLGRLKTNPINRVAQEGNRYNLPAKSLYHTVHADLVKRTGGVN
jgi:hypothetical protein